MEAIKQIFKAPKSHKISVKVPRSIPENESVEVISFFRKGTKNYDKKINELKSAMKDELFLSDLKEVSEEFENIDIQDW